MAGIEIESPVGDAAGMRVKAARIGVDCDILLTAARAVDERCAEMVYECLAGERFREEVSERRRDLERIVDDLRSLQRAIAAKAARVEAAQDACRRLSRFLMAGAQDGARDASAVETEVRRLVSEV